MKHSVRRIELLNFTIFCVLCIAAILPLLSFYVRGMIPDYWLAEGGIYESVGALAVFVGSVVLLLAFYHSANAGRTTRNWWLCLMSLALLILCGEEISWGQRLFNIELSEELIESNYQGELNFHNTRLLSTGNTFVSRLLAQLLSAYLILVPMFVAAFSTANRFANKIRLPIPGLDIALVALIAKMASTITLRFIHGLDVPAGELEDMNGMRMSEMLECIYEVCLLWAACGFLYRELGQRKLSTSA